MKKYQFKFFKDGKCIETKVFNCISDDDAIGACEFILIRSKGGFDRFEIYILDAPTREPFCQCLHEIENKLKRTKFCFMTCRDQREILRIRNNK